MINDVFRMYLPGPSTTSNSHLTASSQSTHFFDIWYSNFIELIIYQCFIMFCRLLCLLNLGFDVGNLIAYGYTSFIDVQIDFIVMS